MEKTTEVKHDIDPRKKDYNWVLNCVENHWSNAKRYLPVDCMYHGRDKLRRIKEYAMGMNSIDEYKKTPLGEQITNETWRNAQWSIRSSLQIIREKTISKILQRDFNINARVVDPLAKSQRDEFYNKLKIKIIARQEAAKQNPDLLNMPALQMLPGEPKDLEELEMYMEYGYKNHIAMESEMVVDYVFRQNDIDKERKKSVIGLVDFGFGGYKEELLPTGETIFESIDLENFLTSYCEQPDFSDAVCWGRIINISFADLSKYYNASQLEEVKKACSGKWGNPEYNDSRWRNDYVKFKAEVWDVEFESWNDYVYEENRDSYDNMRVSKASYDTDMEAAQKKGVGIYRDTQKVYYKAKWIIGTKYMHDFGLCYGAKRKFGNEWNTSASFHCMAWNFHKMSFSGLVERLMPIQDEIQTTIMKIQNFKNKWIPYIIRIDLNSLEKVALGAKGKTMTPMQILDFMFENHVMVARDNSLGGANVNYKSIDVIPTNMAEEFRVLFEDLQRLQAEMQEKSGFNDVTQGGNVNPKMLTSGYNAALMGTNDSLFLLMDADRKLLESLATGLVHRVQAAVNLGHSDKYSAALGDDSIKMLQMTDEFPLRDIGIFLEDKPNDGDIQELIQNMNMKEQQGLLQPQDIILIKSCSNLKQMESLLAARIKRRTEESRQFELQKIQENNKGQQENAIQLEDEKRKTIGIQLEADLRKIAAEIQGNIVIEKIKEGKDNNVANIQAQAKIIAQQIIADAKKESFSA